MEDGSNLDQIAHARAAVARVVMCRAIDRRHGLSDTVGILAYVAPALVLGGIMALAVAMGFDAREIENSALAGSLMLLCLASLVLVMIAGMMIAFHAGTMLVVSAPVMIPLTVYRLLMRWRDHRRGRTPIQLLRRDGSVPIEWTGGSKTRRHQPERLAREDSELILDEHGLRPRDARDAPPESCPRCAAPMQAPGPGIRRCDHCDLERFHELPGCGKAYGRAHKVIAGVRGGKPYIRNRRELWRDIRDCSYKYDKAARRLRRTAGLYFGAAVLTDIGEFAEINWLTVVGVMGIVILLVPFLGFFYQFSRVYFELRWNELRPGAREYDKHMHREIVRAVAHQGRMGIDALAEHLSVNRSALDTALASLRRRGHAPMYVDHQRGQLVSLHARDASDKKCPSCGVPTWWWPPAQTWCVSTAVPTSSAS